MPFANQRTLDRDVVIGLGATAALGLGIGVVGIARAGSKASSLRTSVILTPFCSPFGGGVSMRGGF